MRFDSLSGLLNILRKKSQTNQPKKKNHTKNKKKVLCMQKNPNTTLKRAYSFKLIPANLCFDYTGQISQFSQASDLKHQQSEKIQLAGDPVLRRLRPSWWICSHDAQRMNTCTGWGRITAHLQLRFTSFCSLSQGLGLFINHGSKKINITFALSVARYFIPCLLFCLTIS